MLGLAAGAAAWSKIAEWNMSEVAVLSVAEDLPGMPGASLLGTTFGPFGSDTVFALGPLSQGQQAQLKVVGTGFSWPNQFDQVPQDVARAAGLSGSFGVVADGFIIPGKQTGAITLVDFTQGLVAAQRKKLSTDDHAWFYHHTEWADVDGDSLPDIVAARAVSPLAPWNHKDGELVWIQNRGNGTFGEEKVLTHGPEVGFTLVDLDNDGKPEVVATEFFKNQQLAIYKCPEKTWAECGEKQNAVQTVVAGGPGPWFNVQAVDLDADGHVDLLATQQEFKDKNGTLIPGRLMAYEQRDGHWIEHVIKDGYLPLGKDGPTTGQGAGSPGTAFAVPMEGGRPHIILSGDDGGVVDFFTPAAAAFEYTSERVFSTTTLAKNGLATVGTVVAKDVDNDGKPELFVPAYSEGKIYMFSLDSKEVIV
jgi:hypothetical protein